MTTRRWIVKRHDHSAAKALADVLGVRPVTAALLIDRGFDTPEKAKLFLKPEISQLHDPRLLKDLDRAVIRIMRAIESDEKILVWGDYDVDGTTGTVLLRKAIAACGGKSDFHIPNRFSEGYGLNIENLEKWRQSGVSLIITVDCGMRAFESAEWAAEKQIDLIITDHHLPESEKGLPRAFAIINPNRNDCSYPDKNLAGVGVAFKLATELLNVRGLSPMAKDLLHIAAIGTVADIMNLRGENRAIVHFGLKGLSETNQPGLKALMDVAGCDREMTSESIGFRIGPRINAAGRMDAASDVVRLLETDDTALAATLAAKLDQRNRERQQLQQEITASAEKMVGDLEKQRFIVVGGEGWHRGVIGLAASRIAERFWRPTLVFSLENEIAHGSGRTVGEIHLLRALESCRDLFEQFGGHAAAAGVKIRAARISELRRRLEDYARKNLSEEDFQPRLEIDANVSSASMDLQVVREIRFFEPFGAGNPKPIFVTRDFRIDREPLVMKDTHLKLKLRGRQGDPFEAVWWDGVSRSLGQTLRPGSRIELAYVPVENIWNGTSRLQLIIEDARTVD